jgi:stage V sporulation protein S
MVTGYLIGDGISVVMVPEFMEVEREGKIRTAVKFVVEPR